MRNGSIIQYIRTCREFSFRLPKTGRASFDRAWLDRIRQRYSFLISSDLHDEALTSVLVQFFSCHPFLLADSSECAQNPLSPPKSITSTVKSASTITCMYVCTSHPILPILLDIANLLDNMPTFVTIYIYYSH